MRKIKNKNNKQTNKQTNKTKQKQKKKWNENNFICVLAATKQDS